MTFIEYGIGHRSGEVDIIGKDENQIWKQIVSNPGTPVARIITPKRIGPWKTLDEEAGLQFADPNYNKSDS